MFFSQHDGGLWKDVAMKCAKDLFKGHRNQQFIASIKELPIICLANGLSGGRKGAKVLQIFNEHGLPSFDCLRLSSDPKYWDSFIVHFSEILDKVDLHSKRHHKDQNRKHNKSPSFRPLILIAGGDGTIAWAISFIDRALLSVFQNDGDLGNRLKMQRKTRRISVSASISTTKSKQRVHDRKRSVPAVSKVSGHRIFKKKNDAKPEIHSEDEGIEDVIREFRESFQSEMKHDDEDLDSDVMDKESVISSEQWDSMILGKTRMSQIKHSNQELLTIQSIYESETATIFGLIPLGTGNDLSRCLGTGTNYPGSEILLSDLVPRYLGGAFTTLDRWSIQFLTPSGVIKQRQTSEMLCYFSLGFEAEITLQYDQSRREDPDAFNTRFKSKMQWVVSGIDGVMKEMNAKSKILNQLIEVYADGQRVELPEDIRSLVVCNIQSMSDGMYYWGDGQQLEYDIEDSEWTTPKLNDGKLELMSAQSLATWLKMKIKVPNLHYHRLAQPRRVSIVVKEQLAVMVDGEAWMEDEGVIELGYLHRIFAVIGDDEPRGVTRLQR